MRKDITLNEVEKLEKEFELNRDNFESISRDEFLSFKKEIEESAKQKQISLKIANSDLEGVKARASEKGFKYQSVIKALIHQYATGKIKI